MPANEKRRYVMTSDLRQYIAEYTVANFWRYPIRRRVTYASALECSFTFFLILWSESLLISSSNTYFLMHWFHKLFAKMANSVNSDQTDQA